MNDFDRMPRGPGIVQQKILLLLSAGFVLGLSRSPIRSFRIFRLVAKEWKSINRQALWRSIKTLYTAKLVSARYNKDGTYTLILTKRGQERALTYRLEDIKVQKPAQWDKKWRIITFDIPEKQKKMRDALRFHLRRMGFKEFQKSVFVCPYPCENEINFLLEFYQARLYVRTILAESMDNDLHFRMKFALATN